MLTICYCDTKEHPHKHDNLQSYHSTDWPFPYSVTKGVYEEKLVFFVINSFCFRFRIILAPWAFLLQSTVKLPHHFGNGEQAVQCL